jgi:hypothetical protein
MENTQKQTDYQILKQYMCKHPGVSSNFTPDAMIREALHYIDHIRYMRELIYPHMHHQLLHEYTCFVARPTIISQYTHYLFEIATYILIKLDGPKTANEKNLLHSIEEQVPSQESAYWVQKDIDEVIRQMQNFQKSAPKFYQPLDEFREITMGKDLGSINWIRLLREMIQFSRATGLTYPHYIVLHTFLIFIPDMTLRLEVLYKLRDVASLALEPQEAEIILEESQWLVSVYQRLRLLLINHSLPSVWEYDPDFNELVLWMDDLTPEELVALSQAIIDSRKAPKRYGVVAQVLKIPKYINQIITDSGLDFCRGLYLAIGDRQYVQSGVGEGYREMPTLDTQSIIFMNKCYQIFINYRIAQLRETFIKEHQHDKPLSYYLWVLYKDLEFEFDECYQNDKLHMDNRKAYLSLKARFEDLLAYITSAIQIEQEKEDAQPHNDKFFYIISDDDAEINKIHKRIEMYILSPAKLRDELIRLQEDKLVSLPMDNPTAIIREIRRIWGNIAPKERSFVTTWGRRF